MIFVSDAAILSILLPNQVGILDPANKVANLGLITTVSFTFTIFAQPLVGALSDRTRGRLGRRAPWMIVGSVVAGGFLVGMGGLGSVLWICVFWVVIQFALNAINVAVSSFVPDRFPSERRGLASAVIGVGAIGGGAVGTIVAGQLVDRLQFVYTLLGIMVVVASILFVVFNREAPTDPAEASSFDWRSFMRGFWIDPRQHPDFAWAFASRLMFILGYYLVYAFQLYVLTDYIQVPQREANTLLGLLTVVSFVTIVVSVAVGGWMSDRLKRRKIFVIAASVLLMIALAIPLALPTVGGMALFFALKGLGFGLYLACGTALVAEILPNGGASSAKDLGIYNVATNLPQAIAPALAALLISSFGGYPALFVSAIVGVAASALLMTKVRGVR
jgi:MFS family permease